MADKKEAPKEPTFIEINGKKLETVEVEFRGDTFTLRELTVDENDEIDEATKQPDDTINGRLNLRMCLAKSIVTPPTSLDDLGSWGGKQYLVMSRAYNRLNSLPVDAQGNA